MTGEEGVSIERRTLATRREASSAGRTFDRARGSQLPVRGCCEASTPRASRPRARPRQRRRGPTRAAAAKRSQPPQAVCAVARQRRTRALISGDTSAYMARLRAPALGLVRRPACPQRVQLHSATRSPCRPTRALALVSGPRGGAVTWLGIGWRGGCARPQLGTPPVPARGRRPRGAPSPSPRSWRRCSRLSQPQTGRSPRTSSCPSLTRPPTAPPPPPPLLRRRCCTGRSWA